MKTDTTRCLPPDPSRYGWHRLETLDGGCSTTIAWNPGSQRWDDSPSNQITPEEMASIGWRWLEHVNV